ncbi:MAG: PilW family protein [Vitreoscilla sp.]|nr:PilW family protein [Vitreoscilla sp.]
MAASIHGQGRRGPQAGFSLVELMISMVIGMVVVGAVLAAYLGAGATTRTSRAMSQITEDASVALSVLRSGIGMVGYSNPTGIVGNKFTKSYNGNGLFGCNTTFQDATIDLIDDLTCAEGAGPNAIAVAYEADSANSVVNVDNVPLDCLGNAIDPGAGPTYLAYNRYYLDDSKLMCMGPVNNTPDALVDNVVDLQFRYGVAIAADVNKVGYYADAGNVGVTPANANWDNTVSVRICVVIASAENVLEADGISYRDCDGVEITPADGDRRMFRAFTTTVVLQNRLGTMR